MGSGYNFRIRNKKKTVLEKNFNGSEPLSQGGYLPINRAEPCGSDGWWLTTRPAGGCPYSGWNAGTVPQPAQQGGPEGPVPPLQTGLPDPDPPKNPSKP